MNEKNFIQGIFLQITWKNMIAESNAGSAKEKQLKSADSSIAAALLYSEYLKGQSVINSSSKVSYLIGKNR